MFERPEDLPETLIRLHTTSEPTNEYPYSFLRYRHVDVDDENVFFFGQRNATLEYILDRECDPGFGFYKPEMFNEDQDHCTLSRDIRMAHEQIKIRYAYWVDLSEKYNMFEFELHCTVRLFVLNKKHEVVAIYQRPN